MVAQVAIHWIGEIKVIASACVGITSRAGARVAQKREAARIFHGESAQESLVKESVDGRVRADAEC